MSKPGTQESSSPPREPLIVQIPTLLSRVRSQLPERGRDTTPTTAGTTPSPGEVRPTTVIP